MLDLLIAITSEAFDELTMLIAGLRKTLLVVDRDLESFSALCLARFIVWREIHGRSAKKNLTVEVKHVN